MTILILFCLYAIALSVALAIAGVRPASGGVLPRHTPGNSTNKLLIIGATGGTGRQLVSQALEQGYAVTALVRNPAKLKIEHPKLNILQGNVLDYAAVETAVRGQEAVISALGHKQFFYPTRILSAGTANLLRAMEKHNVHRFVCQTSLGIGSSAGRMGLYYTFFVIPLIVPFYFWDKTRQEQLIAQSNLDWTIVRPGVLNNKGPRGVSQQGPDIGNYLWTVRISRADVANFMLTQLRDDSSIGTATGLCW